MSVPSNAISPDPVSAGNVPRDPHVGGLLGWQGALLQSPRESGARQSRATGGQVLQGPAAQSLSVVQVVALPPVPPEALVVALPPVPLEELVVALPPVPPDELVVALPPVPPDELVLVVALPAVPLEELVVALPPVPLEEPVVAPPSGEVGAPPPPHDAATSSTSAVVRG
jgi:hypothetical protein